MKQSKKLLSLVLAIILMFGTVSVVANAGLVKGDVNYDVIDNAALTAEQVADLALDYVDSDVMYSINKGKKLDLSILGSIRTDTIDHMLADVYDLYDGFWWAIGKGLLGDCKNLDLSMLKNVQRSGGDLNVIYALLKLIGCDNNAKILKKAGKGIGTSDGLSLGLIKSFLGDDLDEINGYITNLDEVLAKTLYDELLYGSYAYQGKEKSKNITNFSTEIADANTVDKSLSVAVNNLLSTPQDYKWEGEGDDKVKVWNENSIVSRKFVENYDSLKINLNSDSVLGIVDKLFDAAVAEFGPTYLNNDVKKLLMEAVGVDFVRLDDEKDAKLIDTIKKSADYVDVAGSDVRENDKVTVSDKLASVQNYLCDAQLWQVDGVWYFRDYQKITQKDADGNAILDENGNEVRVKQDRFFKADLSGANEFYDAINWDYTVDASFITKATTIDTYGSLFGSLNHILYQVLNTAVNKDVISQQELDALWVDGANSNLNGNIERVAKYILKNYTRRVFGKSSEYVDPETGKATAAFAAKVDTSSLIGLVEYIGLPMFGDAMPQLILPENGLEGVADNQKLYAFGAAILREFMTQIAAERNYDSYIFTNINGDRKFVTHTSEEWLNLLLNMGMDIAYEYTNKALVDFVDDAWPTEGITADRWKGMLNKLIDWAVDYIGDSSSSVLVGLEGSEINKYDEPLDKISYALNKILPLGFISGCSGTIGTGENATTVAFSLQACLDNVIRPLIEDLDIAAVISLFGRDNSTSKNGTYNILTDKNTVSMILDLANRILGLVLGVDLLDTTNCTTALSGDKLVTLIYNLLTSLNNRKEALLVNALPVVAEFYPEWGGEQEIDTPKITLKDTIELSNGAITDSTFTFSNGSVGVWRSYVDKNGSTQQDNQYKYECVGVDVKDINDNTVSEVTVTAYPTNQLDFGESGDVKFSVSGISEAGKVVRFDVNYKVYAEDGAALADGAIFTVSKYVYLAFNPNLNGTDAKIYTNSYTLYKDIEFYVYFNWVAIENGVTAIPNLNTFRIRSEGSRSGNFAKISTGEQRGITVTPFTGDGTSKDSKDNSIKTNEDDSPKVNGETYEKTGDNVTGKNFAVNEANYNASTFTPGDILTWDVTAKAYKPLNSKSNGTKDSSVSLFFYSGDGLDNVSDIVKSETKKNRKASDYETGDVLATKLLKTKTTEENNKKVLKETLSDLTGNLDGETVTRINGKDAWDRYVAAFNEAVRLAYQPWNANSVYNHQEAYENLRAAAADLDLCKIDETKVTASAGADKDKWALALKTAMNAAEDSLGGKSFYDYKMYRWSRYEDARKDARNLVAAFTNQNYTTAEEYYFTYRSDYKVQDLNEMIAGNKYETYIKALYEDYTNEEIEANKTSLAKAKNNYANISVLDYANAANYVKLTADRLLERDTYANVNRSKTQHLKNEYDSAVAVIGTANNAGYTAKSWARYADALASAKAILDKNSDLCDEIFDAKYELQVARNELRTEEADDSELKALIAQAQNVLATVLETPTAYTNSNKEIGEVLAALGMADVKDLDGNDVDLFPNGALNVVEKSYDVDETKKYDRAANALREALSKLRFAGAKVENAVKTVVGTEKDDNNVVTNIYAETLTIAQRLTAAQAAAKVQVSGGTSVVSVNGTYALAADDKAAFTGTGSTLTVMDSANKPLYTINLVVKGDVNGDGVVDVLDLAMVERAHNEHIELTGLYLAAAKGGTQSDLKAPTAADYSAVVNLALAD